MSDERTRADALRFFLTGASSHGGAQASPGGSLGRFASSSLAEFLASSVSGSGLSNVTVDYIGPTNGTGTGTLSAVTVDKLAWTPPGGAQGNAITIANGETKILEGRVLSGGDYVTDPSRYVRVTRTSTDDLTGARTFSLADQYNNVVGMSYTASAGASSGVTVYRCIACRNVYQAARDITGLSAWLRPSAFAFEIDGASKPFFEKLPSSGPGSIEGLNANLSSWPPSGYALITDSAGAVQEVVYYSSRTQTTLTIPAAGRGLLTTSATVMAATDIVRPWDGLALAWEAPASQPSGSFGGYSGGFVAPSGLTWSYPYSSATATTAVDPGSGTAGSLEQGEQVGLWLRYEVPAGAVASASFNTRAVRILYNVIPD